MATANLYAGWIAIFVGLVAVSSFSAQIQEAYEPADRVLAEVDRICELWQRPFLEFADDNAFVSKRYWKELLYDGQWERCTLFDINYRPQPMTVDELRAGYHRLAVELYSDEITKWRRGTFNRKYLRASKHSSEKAT